MEDNGGLDRLCRVYEQLDGVEKEEIVRLAEGLLERQQVMSGEKPSPSGKTAGTELWTE